MGEKEKTIEPREASTRRQIILGSAVLFGSFAAGAVRAWSRDRQSKPETPSTGADKTRTFLHQEINFKAGPVRIYAVLLDSKQFSAFSGEPAEISREAGGTFSMFEGKIVGRNIELVPDQRIVQAWRPASWEPGVYSVVRFELQTNGTQTKLILDHTGFPEGNYGHLNEGWKMRYWQPLEKYLS